MSEIQWKKEIAELKKQLEFTKIENDSLKFKVLDLEDKIDDLKQLNKKTLKSKNEEIDKIKSQHSLTCIQNSDLEKQNFELKQQIDLDSSRGYENCLSEKPKLSVIPPIESEQAEIIKPKSKSVQIPEVQSDLLNPRQIRGQQHKNLSQQYFTEKESPQREQINQNGINNYLLDLDKNSISLINQELTRRNIELTMKVEKYNEVYNTSAQILNDLNLQISNLVSEKEYYLQQVDDLEQMVEQQQSQIILLIAENKELIQRLESHNSGYKINIMNTTNGTVSEFINNLQQYENAEQIDWSQQLQKRSDKNDQYLHNPHENGTIIPQNISTMNDQNENNNYAPQNGYRSNVDETVLFSKNNQNDDQTHINNNDENKLSIQALSQQIIELTQKLSIISEKMSETEKAQQLAPQDNSNSTDQLKNQLKERDLQVEQFKLQLDQQQSKITCLEEEIEIQKAEFDNTVDDLYQQFESKLQIFKQSSK